MKTSMAQFIADWNQADGFSGVIAITKGTETLFQQAYGQRNRGEGLPNTIDTAFAIASGTKLFTGLAVCKLIDEGKLSLDTRIRGLLPYPLPMVDEQVTIRHLLTHTSGIGDYIDEESDDSYAQLAALYTKYPAQLWENMSFYHQLVDNIPQKFAPGRRFGYSNSGFVLLGMAIEAASGQSYQQFVTDSILTPCGLTHTGFYRADCLPANTAMGYLQDEESGQWRTNVFCMPVRGGSDGGLYTCAGDLRLLWRAIFACKLFSADMLRAFTAPQVARTRPGSFYGLGVYVYTGGKTPMYSAVGGDFGIDFFTAYFPEMDLTASALGNTEMNTYPILNYLLTLIDG